MSKTSILVMMSIFMIGILSITGSGGGGDKDDDSDNVVSPQWTWVSGSDSTGQTGEYGTMGTASASNIPGARDSSISWKDSYGNLWLFGGYGYDGSGYIGELNDLWMFNVSTEAWTWVSGSNSTDQDQAGVYGTQGTGSTSNYPGARLESVSWSGNDALWLFGGYGYASPDVTNDYGYLNDLWKLDPVTKAWTWVSGSDSADQAGEYGTQGTGSTSNYPGARYESVSWTDSDGSLWLFGGYGYGSDSGSDGDLNDLWIFDPSTEAWTWISGSDSTGQAGEYGTQGSPDESNIPGARSCSISWTGSDGNLWLFGGYSYNTNRDFNDLWRYNPSTNEWTWISGSNSADQAGEYGTQGSAGESNVPGARSCGISWTDSDGNLWLFGGYGYGSSGSGTYGDLNDLWKYDISTGEWTWISGSDSADQAGEYGTQGSPGESNVPGARSYSISWTDSDGNLLLFGGYGFDSSDSGGYGELNDLWKFEP